MKTKAEIIAEARAWADKAKESWVKAGLDKDLDLLMKKAHGDAFWMAYRGLQRDQFREERDLLRSALVSLVDEDDPAKLRDMLVFMEKVPGEDSAVGAKAIRALLATLPDPTPDTEAEGDQP